MMEEVNNNEVIIYDLYSSPSMIELIRAEQAIERELEVTDADIAKHPPVLDNVDRTVDFSGESLTSVPSLEIISQAHRLGPNFSTLDLSENKLYTVPSSLISALQYVVRLDLEDNKIRQLPENFGIMEQLAELYLQNNQLARLPLSFTYLKNLIVLNLSNNPLVASLKRVVGECNGYNDYRQCAKTVVSFMTQVNWSVRKDRQAKLIQKQLVEMEEERLAHELEKAAAAALKEAKDKEKAEADDKISSRGIFRNKNDVTDVNRFFRSTKDKHSES